MEHLTSAAGTMMRSLALAAVAAAVLSSGALAGCPFGFSHSHGKGEGVFASTPMKGQLPMANDASDPLVALNKAFHAEYRDAQDLMMPPVYLIQEADYLVGYKHGARTEYTTNTALYHNYKMVCHIPLGMYMILIANTSNAAALDTNTIARLEDYRAKMDAVVLNETRFPHPGSLEVQLRLYDSTYDFLEHAIATGETTLAELKAFAWSQYDDLSYNLYAAAKEQIYVLHEATLNFTSQLTDEEFSEMVVALPMAHMAFQDSLPTQYFGRFFNDRPNGQCGEDSRWGFYNTKAFNMAGSYSTEEAVLKTVKTHLSDFHIAEDFFHDIYRMHRDALADGAKAALDELFGPQDEEDDDNNHKHKGDDDDDDEIFTAEGIVLGLFIGIFASVALFFIAKLTVKVARKRHVERWGERL